MIKTLTNVLKQDKEKFAVPRKVQDIIPVRSIWPDGIFLTGKNKFSKTYRFTDINYAVASRDDKAGMFLGYSELLNSLDSGCTAKITINNRRLNMLDFEDRILLRMMGDPLDVYEDWTGERKKKVKRGFKTRREAKDWEQSFLENKAGTMEMTFAEFYDLYSEDMKPRLRHNTWCTKDYIVQEKILPYFGKKRMCDIKTSDIIKWQNMLMVMKDDGGRFLYSRKYLKTIQSQFSSIMNHAVRLYNLKSNPIHAAGPIGGDERTVEMSIWTTDEYRAFSEAISDNIESFTAFEILYWSGLHLGEMLALTPGDIDFENDMIDVNKSLQHLEGQIIVTPPKTKKGIRKVKIPHFLTREIEIFVKMQYGIMADNRIFRVSKSGLHLEMKRGCAISGVKKIRIHDLRHSHVSMLIEMGFTPVDIANRVGHENIDITMHYAHMFPHKQNEIVGKLELMNTWQEAV